MYSRDLYSTVHKLTYEDIDSLLDIYNKTEGLENCLHLMNPDNLYTVIENAVDKLAEAGMAIMTNIYKDNYNAMPETMKIEFMPTAQMRNSLLNHLLGDRQWIEARINHYGIIYNSACKTFCSGGSDTKTIGGAALGGFIGSVLGPLGAVVGSIVGGAMCEGPTREELDSKSSSLCHEFSVVIDSTVSYLKSVQENMMEVIVKYNSLIN